MTDRKRTPDLKCAWDKEKGEAVILGKDGKPVVEIKGLVDDSTTIIGKLTGAKAGQDYVGQASLVDSNVAKTQEGVVQRVSDREVSCTVPAFGISARGPAP